MDDLIFELGSQSYRGTTSVGKGTKLMVIQDAESAALDHPGKIRRPLLLPQ
jgi:hypothetical protein